MIGLAAGSSWSVLQGSWRVEGARGRLMVNASLLKYIFWSKQRSQNQNGYEIAFLGTLSCVCLFVCLSPWQESNFVCFHISRRATHLGRRATGHKYEMGKAGIFGLSCPTCRQRIKIVVC